MPLLSTFGAGSTRGWGRAARLVKPGAPTGFSATGRANNSTAGGAFVYFTAPVDNGGANITSYQVENMSTGVLQTVFSSGSLVNLAYQSDPTSTVNFRVRAVNVAGAGDWSNTDPAISYFISAGNNGTYNFPPNTTVYYQMYSGSGQQYKPDTRTYGYQLYTNTWYDNYGGWVYGDFQHPQGLPYYDQALTGYTWWTYDNNWNYIYGYYSYSHGSYTSTQYFYMQGYGYSSYHNTYFSGTQMGGAYTYPQYVQTGGSSASGPTYGSATILYVNGSYHTQTGQGYNRNPDVLTGSYTFGGSSGTLRQNHGSSGGESGYADQGYGYFYFGT